MDRASDDRASDATVVRSTRRWRGIVAVVLGALAVGVLAKRPSILLVAAVGVAFAAYPRIAAVPDPALSIERRMTSDSPAASDTVGVATTLRNEGETTLFDLRVVDGVPPSLPVASGTPRLATTLRPGEETTFEYSLRASRGVHRFRPATVLARDPSGAIEVETTVTDSTAIECQADLPEVPLRSRSRNRTGRLVTDEGGGGLEFHRIQEFESGDPVNRIDWRRFARTGELTAVEFRRERLAEVVVCVDARAAAYRASSDDDPNAVAHAIDAAERIAISLFESGHRVGLAAVGRSRCWLRPGTGRDHQRRFRRLLGTHPVFSAVPPGETRLDDDDGRLVGDGVGSLDEQLAAIRMHLSRNAQVIVLTPLCDDASVRIVQTFEHSGRAAIVVSPDVTTGTTVGGRLGRIERKNRLDALRSVGVPAVDWNTHERLDAALTAIERWDA